MNGKAGFRILLRTVNATFKGDLYAIKSARIRLKEEFLKNKYVQNPQELRMELSFLFS
jgi:hypothetical protein